MSGAAAGGASAGTGPVLTRGAASTHYTRPPEPSHRACARRSPPTAPQDYISQKSLRGAVPSDGRGWGRGGERQQLAGRWGEGKRGLAAAMASLVKKIISTAKAPAALGPYRYALARGSRSLEGGVCQAALGAAVRVPTPTPPRPDRGPVSSPVTPQGHLRPYSTKGSAVLAANCSLTGAAGSPNRFRWGF